MPRTRVVPPILWLSLTTACFGPSDVPADETESEGVGSDSSTTGAEMSAVDSSGAADTSGLGTTGAQGTTGELPQADSSTGEPPTPCEDVCVPDYTSSCTEDGTAEVECVTSAEGCHEYEVTACVDAVCIADQGCVAVLADSCAAILEQDSDAADGVFTIDVDGPGGLGAFEVECDMSTDGGGWTLIAFNDATDTFVTFDRTWAEYKEGFGMLTEEGRGWLGNDRIHFLTGGGVDLRVQHDQGAHYYADFSVANEVSLYQMVVTTTPDSNDGGSFEAAQGAHFFSTVDNDNDVLADPKASCAENFSAGWWYGACYAVSLAGSAGGQVHWRDAAGVELPVEWIDMWVR